jgi:hypothetical protein
MDFFLKPHAISTVTQETVVTGTGFMHSNIFVENGNMVLCIARRYGGYPSVRAQVARHHTLSSQE